MALVPMDFDEPITTITPTVGSNKVSINNVNSITKRGHMVCANIAVNLTGTFAYQETILSGLPKPVANVYRVNDYIPSGSDIAFNITTNGVLEIRNVISSALSNTFFTFSVAYMTNE